MINTALTLGYNVETGTKYGGSAIDEYIATQILIWLIAHWASWGPGTKRRSSMSLPQTAPPRSPSSTSFGRTS